MQQVIHKWKGIHRSNGQLFPFLLEGVDNEIKTRHMPTFLQFIVIKKRPLVNKMPSTMYYVDASQSCLTKLKKVRKITLRWIADYADKKRLWISIISPVYRYFNTIAMLLLSIQSILIRVTHYAKTDMK